MVGLKFDSLNIGLHTSSSVFHTHLVKFLEVAHFGQDVIAEQALRRVAEVWTRRVHLGDGCGGRNGRKRRHDAQ
jgi:hypothetical protein